MNMNSLHSLHCTFILITLGETAAGAKPVNCHASTRGAYACTAESISHIKSVGIHDSMINAEIAVKVLNSLTHNVSSAKYNLGRCNQETVLDRLASAPKEERLNAFPVHSFILKNHC